MAPEVEHPGRRRTRTPSTRVAPELLQAAECVLVRNGKAGLTVRAVAAEADVAPMGVYNWLGGKVGLVAALLLIGSDRLSAAMERNDGRDVGPRLRVCCLRYREFALANPELYEIMFEGFTSCGHGAAGSRRYAAACFGVLVRNVELAAAADALTVPDAREAAQQIWGALHGAVTLELKDLVQTPDPAATYLALVDSTLRGLGIRQR